MNITLLGTTVKDLQVSWVNESPEGKGEFNLGFDAAFSSESNDSFIIVFTVEVRGRATNKQEGYLLRLEFIASFKTDDEIDNAFKESHFVRVNAPAIAYPYLRAYVSNLTLLSGYETLVLPTINFTKVKGSVNKNDNAD